MAKGSGDSEFGLPIGFALPGWQSALRPPHTPMFGRLCRVEPIDVHLHGDDLFQAFAEDGDGRSWTYLPYGPFQDIEVFQRWMTETCLGADPLFHVIVDASNGRAVGVASYLRISPEIGVIEVGHIHFSQRMRKSPMGTEAMYLMMRRAFDELGYRRYEWKCDALNGPSRSAAERLGMTYEGVFRQATIYKGRNRDTAWYSVLDREWPRLKTGFETWLQADNFADDGTQVRALGNLI
ncbi:GNAT family N-acetyltransferase [Myxococcota bacterium]|nr:GNAT family N-acetyltransferase [Myxococcota bacterium]